MRPPARAATGVTKGRELEAGAHCPPHPPAQQRRLPYRQLGPKGPTSLHPTPPPPQHYASGSALAAAESSSLVTAGAGGEDAGVFTVRAILDRHGEGAGAQYLVHWDGYTRDEATWEPAAHLTGAREAVGHYERAREARAAVSERRLAVLAPSRARPTRTQSATRG